RDRAADAGRDELRQWMLLQRPDDAGAEIRKRADVEDGATSGELGHETGILDRADAVPDPVGAQLLERSAHRRRACRLARVRDGSEPEGAREGEGRLVRLRRELSLEPTEPDRDDSALPVLGGVADHLLGLLLRGAAEDVGREAHLDAVPLPCLL